jgi:hypothetical protein
MADQPGPIEELRKDFDRLRTVLFTRVRTQSSSFNYKGKRNSLARERVEPRQAHAPRHPHHSRAPELKDDSVGKVKALSIQATSAGP